MQLKKRLKVCSLRHVKYNKNTCILNLPTVGSLSMCVPLQQCIVETEQWRSDSLDSMRVEQQKKPCRSTQALTKVSINYLVAKEVFKMQDYALDIKRSEYKKLHALLHHTQSLHIRRNSFVEMTAKTAHDRKGLWENWNCA